jgi:hypothetical protein
MACPYQGLPGGTAVIFILSGGPQAQEHSESEQRSVFPQPVQPRRYKPVVVCGKGLRFARVDNPAGGPY